MQASNRFLLAMVVGVGLAASVHSRADTLTLRAATSEAKERSPLYREAKAAADEASWKPLEALSENIPHLSAGVNHLFGETFAYFPAPINFPFLQPITTLSLDASWTIFDGFKTPYNVMAAHLIAEAARLDLSRAELQLEGDISNKFYQALAAQKLADVAKQNLKTLEDHLSQARALLAGGEATRYDILRIQTQLEEARPDQISADDNVVLTRAALTVAMGIAHDDRPLEGELPIPNDQEVQRITGFQIEEREDVQALQRRAEASEKMRTVSRSTWLPRISLFAQKQFYNDQPDGGFLNTDQYRAADSVGFTLSWNLFDGGASIARQKEATFEGQRVQAAADVATLNAPNEFETYKRRFTSNVSLYRARLRAIDSAEESVRLAKAGFGAGTRTNTDVIDSELDLFRARAGLVQSQLNAAQALIGFQLAVGRKL